jgi:hypothetical protein
VWAISLALLPEGWAVAKGSNKMIKIAKAKSFFIIYYGKREDLKLKFSFLIVLC